MKRKISILSLVSLVALVFIVSGCSSTNKLVAALAKDPATLHLRITSIYGVIELTRTNPNSNTLAHAVSPEGSVTVTKSNAVSAP